MTTYERLARALSYLDYTNGRTADDLYRITFARQQIAAVLDELRARRCCTPVEPQS